MKLRENRSNMVQTEVSVKSITNCGELTDNNLPNCCLSMGYPNQLFYLNFTLQYISLFN